PARRPDTAAPLLVRHGDAERGSAGEPRRAVLIEGVEFLDREAGGRNELDDWTSEMASAEEPLLYRVEPSLPATYRLVRRQAVLDEVQAPAWLENTPQLAQGGSDVRNRAQCPGGQGSVKTLIQEG